MNYIFQKMEKTKKVREYYVYELREKNNARSSIFYVGKGKSLRKDQHIKEVIKKLLGGKTIKTLKEKKIAELLSKINNSEIEVLIIGRYETEKEAEAVEATLINWVYGISELTNIVRGKGSQFIRNKGDFNFNNLLEDSRTRSQKFEDNNTSLNYENISNNLRKNLSSYRFHHTTIPMGIRGNQDYTFNWNVPNSNFYLEFKLNKNGENVVINARPQKGYKNNFMKVVRKAGYLLSNESAEVFAALADYNNKPQFENGVQYNSFLKGVPITNVEEIVKLIQDFRIRLMLAQLILSSESEDSSLALELNQCIDIFKQRPEAKRNKKLKNNNLINKI